MQNGNIGIELRYLNNLIRRYVDNKLHKKYIDSVTGTNGWIIGYIADHGDVYQKDLETEFGITRSTASKVVSLMVQKGLIEHRSVPQDARLKKLVLTDKALELSKLMNQDHEAVETTLKKGFTEEELSNLHSYIERMKQNILEQTG
ncbi:MarR family winged helix-turn-helix transcriptional regulator [Fumia xinanensis]|uniref:Winged helix-turn-helix transcriptional regulator n=1 Tax=Fumia xinanensis TaxID=2763659 RepID=A0A926I219_9FIRM|nr:MarR family winged helix-turn-helix transcriptional regulator [Fumia xinanensis]MBC8559093.1 winged helix-turn-helix transcriptional regulator [Fumia xinanensis]